MHALFLKNLFGQLLDISPKSFICLNSFNSEFSKVWFTDQNSNYLFVRDYGFLPFDQNITKNIGKFTSKNQAINRVKNLLIILRNILQMHLKLLWKKQFKKQQKRLVIWLVIKLLIKRQKSQDVYHRTVQKQLKKI